MIVAGIDVGNSTTEVVLARLRTSGIEVLGTARAGTRGGKGSPPSLDGAAALVARLERRHDVQIEAAAAAWLRPVETTTLSLPEPEVMTGRLRVVRAGSSTAGGLGFGAGHPFRLGDPTPPGPGPYVVVVPAGFGYREAADEIGRLSASISVAAVAVEDDEAVLVSNRLGSEVPVVDEISAAALLSAPLIAVEVASPGAGLRTLTDALALVSALGLDPAERADAARLALILSDASNAVVVVDGASHPVDHQDERPGSAAAAWAEFGGGERTAFPGAHQTIAAGTVGLTTRFAAPSAQPGRPSEPIEVDDVFTVDLAAISDAVLARRGSTGSRAIGVAVLRADAPLTDPARALEERLGVPVSVGTESRAAFLGGCTTAGADPVSSAVIDLGGGTIDVAKPDHAVVAAGAGELLTRCVAALTSASIASAEWVKRTAAHRVESPQILLAEDGTRAFLDRPAPAETIGALVVEGPAGLLAFNRTMAPGEWRALRHRLKAEAIGGNVARALRTLGGTPESVIVVGGPAGDEEVLTAVARALPLGVAIGRGNVAGQLGHRYAAAYGLLSLL